MAGDSANHGLLLDQVPNLLDLWFTQINETDSSQVAQALFARPLGGIVLDELQSAGRGRGQDCDELVVVDLGGRCGLDVVSILEHHRWESRGDDGYAHVGSIRARPCRSRTCSQS